MGNQHGKERRIYGRRIDWENAEKPSPPGKPYLVPEGDERDTDFITIRWAPPVSDGGAPILGYVVEHRRTGSPHWLRAVPYLAVETKLTLTGLEPGWRYQFRVSAENELGRSSPGEVSDVLTVTSQRTAATSPHFNVELRDTVALENEKVEFTVHVVAIPQAKISWYKDGFEVFSSRRMKIVTENDESTFIIHQAALEDEGEIKCTATNRAGHSVTKAILKLEAPPRIRLPRQYEDGLLFEKGELIRLKVSTAGRPQPIITWYHDGELLQNNQKYEITNAERCSSLRIREAQRNDRGEYQIKGVNKVGEDFVSFLVTITDRPTPPGKAKVVMALGKSVTLSWTSPEDDGGCKIGNYIVEYYRVGWNMWLKATTCRQLATSLSDLIEGSEYRFRVKAENPYGVSDPGEESDLIFIPDPKRGILSPPAEKDQEKTDPWLNGFEPEPTNATESDSKSEKRKMLEENARKLLDAQLPVLLSQEETIKKPPRKVATASPAVISEGTKRSFEDVGSENVPPPVPKRRHKGEKQGTSPTPDLLVEVKTSEVTLSTDRGQGLSEVEELRLPREKDHTMFHGSSELMLVLLPEESSKSVELSVHQRSEIEMSLIGVGVAPPMSLSAPELGSDEPMELPIMRDAVSSSELLHERAMARLYQDAMLEESQKLIKRRWSGDRKSVERRSSLRDGSILERRHIFVQAKENETDTDQRSKIPIKSWSKTQERSADVSTGKELISPQMPAPRSKSPERLSSVEREELEFALVRERIRLKNEQNLQQREILPQASNLQYLQNSGSSHISSYGDEVERMLIDDVEEEEEGNYLDEELEEEEEEEEEEEGEEEEKEETDEDMEIPRKGQCRPKSFIRQKSPPPVPKHRAPDQKMAPFAEEEDDGCLAITSRIVLPRLEITLSPTVEVSEESAESASLEVKKTSPVRSVQEVERKEEEKMELFPKKPVATGKRRAVKILKKLGLKKEKKIPEIIVEVDSSISGSALPRPKPILKNKALAKRKEKDTGKTVQSSKEQLSTSCDDASDDGSSAKKKKQVRIAEPSEEGSSRKQEEPSEEEQANKVLIYHYSDIVREFGYGKKPPKQCLSREEMKAFVGEDISIPTTDALPTLKGNAEESPANLFQDVASSENEKLVCTETKMETPGDLEEGKEIFQIASSTEVPPRTRTTIDYLTDVLMFIIACWLYLFKDELYAVPVLCLMAYRQINDALRENWTNMKATLRQRFSRKKADG